MEKEAGYALNDSVVPTTSAFLTQSANWAIGNNEQSLRNNLVPFLESLDFSREVYFHVFDTYTTNRYFHDYDHDKMRGGSSNQRRFDWRDTVSYNGYESFNNMLSQVGYLATVDSTQQEVRVNHEPLFVRLIMDLNSDQGGNDPALVAYYQFENNTLDSSGNDNSGSIVGNVNYAPGSRGLAANFDGTSDYINVNHDASLEVSNQITMSAWVNKRSLNTSDPILIKENNKYGLYTRDNKVRFYGRKGAANTDGIFPTGPTFESNGNITLNNWHHIAVTADGSAARIYIDGQLDNSIIQDGSFIASSGVMQIGGEQSANSYFDGLIDNLRIYNRALTESEIQELYELEEPSVDLVNGLLAHYSFDNVSGNTVLDDSGNSRDLTAVDMAYTGGIKGQAGNFNGISGYLAVAHDSDLQMATLTLSAWLKTDHDGESYAISKGDERPYSLRTRDGVFNVKIGNASQSASVFSTTATDDQWHHVVGTYDGSEVSIYIDGVLENTQTFSQSLELDNTSLNIGRRMARPTFSYFPGLMDEVRIYDRALDASEVESLYNLDKP